jgi:hypothetical protein
MTDISGVSQSIQKIGEQTLKDTAKDGLQQGAASAEDVQKLQAALNQPPAEVQQVAAAQQSQAVEAAGKAAGAEDVAKTPGARILDSINGLRTGMDDVFKDVQHLLEDPSKINAAEMLQLEWRMKKAGLATEVFTKFGAEAEQKLDQILKNQ